MYRVRSLLTKETKQYTDDTLECTPGELRLMALAGKKAEGALFLRASSGRKIQVFLYSTHYRMQPQAGFARGEEIHISYRFDASGLMGGAKVEGYLILLTDIGQLQIPFHVKVTDSYEDEQLGSIRNLFHFTNLASTDWTAAKKLFYSDRMEKLMKGHDSIYLPLYKGLSQARDNERNLDEFLISVGKKKRATYSIDDDTLLLPQVYDAQQQTLTIKRKGWGYSHLTVSGEGKYLTFEKTVITNEDFVDNVCHFVFYLLPTDGYEHREKIHIDTDSPSGRLTCELVRIGRVKKENPKEKEKKEKRRQIAMLMRCYLEWQTDKGDRAKILARAEKHIDNINKTDGHNIAGRLYQTRLLCAMGRIQEAGWIFSHVRRMVEKEEVSPRLMAYYWYVETVLAVSNPAGEVDEHLGRSAARRLRDLLANQRRDPVITCLYLRLLPGDQITPVKKLSLYEECYYGGCSSPLMYLEAFRQIEESPAYLTKLGRFEVSVLRFALANDLLTAGLENRIVELVKREKEARRDLLSFLLKMHAGYQEDDLLQSVCLLLIRCGSCDKNSLYWFRRAVDKQLRITMLYESYIMARGMDDNTLPPKYVLMYFAYQCNLEKPYRAHLYRVLLDHHTRLGALIDLYDPQIREFALSALKSGECSEDLMHCYRFLLRDEEHRNKALPYLKSIAFHYFVKVEGGNIRHIHVREKGLEKERTYPVKDGSAMIEIYTNDYTIVLSDENSNRERADKKITVERVMPKECLKDISFDHMDPEPGIRLYLLSNLDDEYMKSEEYRPMYIEASSDPELSVDLRLDILDRLLKTLYESDDTEIMADLLEEYPIEGADEKKRGQIIAYNIGLSQDEAANQLLWEYGFEGVPPKSLNRLIRRGIERSSAEDPKYLALGYYTYRQGKFTQELLQYLCDYYEGGIKQMLQLFNDAAEFDVDVSAIAERILIASVFSQSYLPDTDRLYEEFSKKAGTDIKRRILQDICFRTFVGGEVISDKILHHIEAALLEDEDIPLLCRQTWLYLMSEREDEPDEREKALIKREVTYYMRTNGYLPFFERFASFMPALLPFASKTYLVYRSAPGHKVTVSYLEGEAGQESYQVRTLPELCPGYYVREFLLFYGEELHYYIQEEKEGGMVLTESGHIDAEDRKVKKTGGRFEMLDAMAMSRAMDDEQGAFNCACEYLEYEKLVDEFLR
ncbi:MAG: hypothetical protein J5842_03405 [Lachnospiraceae bacterium]|nr:hypothetical protein [Lachnospiraceae bacterium]